MLSFLFPLLLGVLIGLMVGGRIRSALPVNIPEV